MIIYILVFEINLLHFEEGHGSNKTVTACGMGASNSRYTQGLCKLVQASFEIKLCHHMLGVVDVWKIQSEQLEKFSLI